MGLSIFVYKRKSIRIIINVPQSDFFFANQESIDMKHKQVQIQHAQDLQNAAELDEKHLSVISVFKFKRTII